MVHSLILIPRSVKSIFKEFFKKEEAVDLHELLEGWPDGIVGQLVLGVEGPVLDAFGVSAKSNSVSYTIGAIAASKVLQPGQDRHTAVNSTSTIGHMGSKRYWSP